MKTRKRFRGVGLLMLLFAALLFAGCSNDSAKPAKGQPAKVTYVVDGDTVDVQLKNGKKERIRMLLVDTPETKHPRLGVQPFGPEASKFTKEQLTGKTVGVELDVSERDKFGRLLAYIWLDGQNFNEELLKKGLARVAYVYAPNTKYVDSFRETQAKAQKKEIGIWSVEDYARKDGFHPPSGYKPPRKDHTPSAPPQAPSASNGHGSAKGRSCTIKGNASSHIYHVPGGASYEQTKAEVMFCSEAEAKEAGYRRAQR